MLTNLKNNTYNFLFSVYNTIFDAVNFIFYESDNMLERYNGTEDYYAELEEYNE